MITARLTWFTRPDEHACLAARPRALSDGAQLVISRVAAHVAFRPRSLLLLIGSWLAIVWLAQALFQPQVACVLLPLVLPAVAG